MKGQEHAARYGFRIPSREEFTPEVRAMAKRLCELRRRAALGGMTPEAFRAEVREMKAEIGEDGYTLAKAHSLAMETRA